MLTKATLLSVIIKMIKVSKMLCCTTVFINWRKRFHLSVNVGFSSSLESLLVFLSALEDDESLLSNTDTKQSFVILLVLLVFCKLQNKKNFLTETTTFQNHF